MSKIACFILGIVLLYQPLAALQAISEDMLYDFQILFDKFDDLQMIDLLFKSEEVKSALNDDIRSFITCFIGFPNSGKTFIFNQILKMYYNKTQELPSGFHVSTEGISGVVNKKENDIHFWIDSEGMQKAVLIDESLFTWKGKIENTNMKSQYQQVVNEEFQKNDIFEKIQNQLLINISNFIVLVIDQLKEQEEKYIYQLMMSQMEGRTELKQIIVIVNCKFEHDIKSIEEKINLIKNRFPLEKSFIGKNFYYYDLRFSNIRYFFLANEYSELGKEINPFVYQNIYNIAEANLVFINILKSIQDYFNASIWKYVNFSFKENSKVNKDFEKLELINQLDFPIKPKMLSISPLGQKQDTAQYAIYANELDGLLLYKIILIIPGEIKFVKVAVFKEKETNHQLLFVKYVQEKDDVFQQLEKELEVDSKDVDQASFPDNNTLEISNSLQFNVKNEFDILITKEDGYAKLLNDQPNPKNKEEIQNGIYTFEIQFIPNI